MNNMPAIHASVNSFAPVVLTPETPPLTCARQIILERVNEMVRFEEGTRKGEDIEALHDMRVWSRRLREALEIFSFCFPQEVYENLYDRVRQVTKTLGKARNADVAVEFFSKRLETAKDVHELFALEDYLRLLENEQFRERKKMQKKLDKKVKPSKLPELFEKTFHELADQPPQRRRGPRSALRLARVLLTDRLRTAFKGRKAISGEEDIEGLHNLRIMVKKLRYAIEAMSFIANENIDRNIKVVKKLQTALGDLHDRDVFIASIQQRHETLQQRKYTSQLLIGYEKIFQHLAAERHTFYLKYYKIFGKAKISEWQKRIVPTANLDGKSAATPASVAKTTAAKKKTTRQRPTETPT